VTVQLPVATARATWAELGAEVRRMPGTTTTAALVAVAAAASGLAAPWVLGGMVDDIIAGAPIDRVWWAVGVVAVAALVGGTLTAAGSMLVARLGETVLARIRERVLDRALHVPSSTVERAGTGDLLARVGSDVTVVTNAITTTGPDMIAAMLTVTLTTGGLFALDWRLGLAGLVAAPVYVYALRWYLPRSAPYYTRERAANAARTQAMVGPLRGLDTVHAYRWEKEHLDRITERSQHTVDLTLTVFRLFTRFASWINRAEFAGLSAVLVVGWFLVRADLATVGAVTAAALYFHRLFNPLGLIVLEFDMVQQAGASLARLVGVSSLPPPPAVSAPPKPADTGIEIRDLRHRYDGGPPVLRGVSLRIAPGERVALVGASGAGKTTLAGLATGLLTPTSGSVLLGGVSLDSLGAAEVRRRIGLISQEVHVFAGTLLEDVTLARPSATEDEAVAALDLVGALEWARALPDGLRTHVGEGAHQLTAAQAQQLALARLVLMDPDVAVLDEATAEAGSAGARDLDRAADAATAGRTTLVVAHRLSQAARADRVVVLDHGEVVEVGRHEELIGGGGRYAELWRSWSGGR
jgi:ATP-binding cassette subfamily C protein